MEEYVTADRDNAPAGGVFNPLNLQTYHYGGNNPIMYSDPTGLSSEPVDNDNEEELPTTGPGAMFKSAEEAAADFAKNYNGKSIEENKEYGSAIYEHTNEDGEKSYYYDEPDIGEGSTVGISYWTDENNPNGDKLAGFFIIHMQRMIKNLIIINFLEHRWVSRKKEIQIMLISTNYLVL